MSHTADVARDHEYRAEEVEMMATGAAYVSPGGSARSLRVMGELLALKIPSHRTGGAYALFEATTQPGGGPPPHVNHREDESFWVLEGVYEFLSGSHTFRAGAGSLVYVPKGTLHAHNNVGECTGRMLVTQTPGGLYERFFEAVGEPEEGDGAGPLVSGCPPDAAKIVETAAVHGIEIPPPFAGDGRPRNTTEIRGTGHEVVLVAETTPAASEGFEGGEVRASVGAHSGNIGGTLEQMELQTARPEEHGGRGRGMDGLVKGLVWVGTRTERYAEMVDFYRDALGLPLEHEEGEFALFRLPDGAKAEVFGPSDAQHAHFSTGPVAGFLVDDVRGAREVLEAKGIEFIGPVHEWEPTGEAWSHFRAPDGNIYEITHAPRGR